jgi:DNA-binding IclR family transcriptional regulator
MTRAYPGFDAARQEIDDLTRAIGHPCFAFALERDHARLLYYTWDLRRPVPAIHVGDTLALLPPIGAVFFAWADENAIDKWVARAPSEGDQRDRLRDILAAIRRLGYVVELQPPSTMLHQALGGRGHIGARLPLTGYDADDFVVTHLVDDDQYSLSSISVPVVDTNGHVTIAFNIGGFASPLSGAEVRRLAAAGRAAAARVVTDGQSTAPRSPTDRLTG